MSSTSKPHWGWRVLAALPDAGLAVAYGMAAFDSALRDGARGDVLWRAAVLEFFAVHASGFLKVTWIIPEWNRTRRVAYVAALTAGYSLVLGVVSLVLGAWWPLITFWLLTANRALDAAVRDVPDDEAMTAQGHAWAGSVVLYVVGASLAGLAGMGRGAVLAVGALYFAAHVVSELGDWWWVYRWQGTVRRRR